MQRPCSLTSRKLCRDELCTICLKKSFASHPRAKFWCQEKNVTNPRQVFKCSHKKYWFKCGECHHPFDARLNDISNDKWCPFCAGQQLCENDTCDVCYEKSFASHPKAKFWCQEKNTVNPRQLFKCSHKKYWFKCGECHHPFETALNNISNQDQWCPYCAGKILCGDATCEICFEKSFASHPRAKYWSQENNSVNPWQVFQCSGKKFWFTCGECHHPFEVGLNSISCYDNWCPFCCVPPQRLCDDNTCEACYDKSFASHPRAKYWDYDKNTKNPRAVFKSSGIYYHFICDQGHHSKKPACQVSKETIKQWCEKCRTCPSCGLWRTLGKLCCYCKPKNRNALYVKTKEYQVVKFLKDALPDVDFIHNKSVGRDCTNGHLFPDIRYDCVIERDELIIPYHLIVEVDEYQHRGASYKCDQQRMHDIVAKLGAPCIFIRYNPDSQSDFDNVFLSEWVKNYLHIKKPVWNDVSALFVIYIGYK
jgi:Probable Zinc-ribbon domain